MTTRFQDIDALLTALGAGASVDQIEYALRDYGTREIIDVLADRAAGGGGGSLPAYEPEFYGASLSTNATDGALMPFTHVGTPDYLDLTVPTVPTFNADGLYAISTDLTLTGGNQAGKFMWGQLGMGPGQAIFVTASTDMDQGTIGEQPGVAMTIVGRVSAGDTVGIYVGHDGANGSGFFCGISVQRIL